GLVAGQHGMVDNETGGDVDEDGTAVPRSASNAADGPVVTEDAVGDRSGRAADDRHAAAGAAEGGAAADGSVVSDRAVRHTKEPLLHGKSAAATSRGIDAAVGRVADDQAIDDAQRAAASSTVNRAAECVGSRPPDG